MDEPRKRARAEGPLPFPLHGTSHPAGVEGDEREALEVLRGRVLVPFLIFLPLRRPAWIVLDLWFLLQAVYSSGVGVTAVGTVAYAAHVVGFIVGMPIAWPLKPATPPPPEPDGILFGRQTRGDWWGHTPGAGQHKENLNHFT